VSKLEAEADKLVSQLSAVRAQLAKVSDQPTAATSTPSSSAEKVSIQPGKQSVIFLQTPGDAAHQITFSFREPKLRKDNTSSLPVYTVLVDTLAIRASMEEYTSTIVNSTYQFLLHLHGISAHPTDIGRCVLLSAHLKGWGVSTRTVSIPQLALALALQTTVSNV
jgi:hypothetical protein